MTDLSLRYDATAAYLVGCRYRDQQAIGHHATNA